MASLDERRRISPAVGELGLAGVALLRLHARRDPSKAQECISEIRRILSGLDDTEPVEVRTPFLDVAAGYARWVEVYDSPGNPLVECEQPAIRPLLDRLRSDPVIDAGCGTGRHIAYLNGRGHRVIGVDVVPQMLEKARAKVPSAEYRLGDLSNIPAEDGEARCLVCSLVLEHVADLAPVYAEFARVVSAGGAIVVSTMHPTLRSVFGWGAWFIDSGGKVDIPTFDHGVADHLNAAATAGLVLRRCEEPVATESALPQDASPISRIAYSEVPMVLVLQFDRP